MLEPPSMIKTTSRIPFIQFNMFLKSQIAQSYLNNSSGGVNSNRPNTTGHLLIEPINDRTMSNQTNLNQNYEKYMRLQDNINKTFFDEEYPSIILHPRKKEFVEKERKSKNSFQAYHYEQKYTSADKYISADKHTQRSMSLGSMINPSKNSTSTNNSNCSTNSKENTPTIVSKDNKNDVKKKSKIILISYKKGRSQSLLQSQSLSKSNFSFSEVSKKVIMQDNVQKKVFDKYNRQGNQTLYNEKINDIINSKNQHKSFQNQILVQNFTAEPKQYQQKEASSVDSQNLLLQNLQNLKLYTKKIESQQNQNKNQYYPIQPFLGKLRVFQNKRVLVKDCLKQI